MCQQPQRARQKGQRMNAALVANDARWMLEQLAMPFDPRDSIKARRERAIRRAGISPAKGMRLWYNQTCALLAHEYLAIKDAHSRWLDEQEKQLAAEIETLRAVRAARRQGELSLHGDTPDHSRSHASSMGAPLAVD